jgi:hypothetical protein
MWRHVQKHGKVKDYKENARFKMCFKMIISLALVPEKFIKKEYENLLNYFLNTNSDIYLINFLFWIEKQYIVNQLYLVKTETKNYCLWSVFTNSIMNKPKTSNSLEGWHSNLNDRINQKHPSLFHLFSELQIEQNNVKVKILKSLYDDDSIDNSKICNNESSLCKVCSEYEKFYGVEYLMKVASLLKVKFE